MDELNLQKRAKWMDKVAVVISVIVLSSVFMMRRVKFDVDIDFGFLPFVHAVLNTGTAIALISALYFIKKKNIKAHRNSILIAMVLSALFLVGYVLYHFTTEETTFCKQGMIKIIYYFVLITHIVLAGLSFPFVLFTFVRGFNYQVEKHRKLAKWVYPVWLYVALTGPIVYIMLKPCY